MWDFVDGVSLVASHNIIQQQEIEFLVICIEKLSEHVLCSIASGNNELEVYTPSNAWIKDGKLVIEAKQVLTPKGSISYTSSKIISRGKADFGIASCKSNSSRCNINKINCNDDESEANCNESTAARRFEAKIRLPWGHGIWPAFWMLPTNDVHGGW